MQSKLQLPLKGKTGVLVYNADIDTE